MVPICCLKSFGQILGNLQLEFPQASIQVINGAIGGTTSNGVLSAGNGLISQVDYLIIYYGHNETAQMANLPELIHVNITRLNIRQWLSKTAYTAAYSV